MKYTLLFIIILLFSVSQLNAQIIASFEFDGINRSYLVDLPADYELYESLPLVFNLHGFGSNNIQQRLYSNMSAVADTGNFIICYPQGVDDAWNVGWNFGSTADDVGFINALIDTLSLNYKVNLDAVFSTGMSNGGFMSYKLACDLNDRIKAVASVTGSMVNTEVQNCNPENPIPVMQIHGTNDMVVAYNGTPGVSIGIETLLDNWLGWNDCTLESDTIEVANIDPTDGTTSQRIEYNDCGEMSRVVFYKVFGGEHTWPGATIDIGTTSQDFDASIEIWNFFRQYTSPLIVSNQEPFPDQVMVNIRPNPFRDYITIEAAESNLQNLRLFNALGEVLVQNTVSRDSRFQISTENLAPGIYFIELENDEGKKVVRVVKQ